MGEMKINIFNNLADRQARAVERAEQVIRDVHKDLPDIWLGGRQRYVLVEAIAAALADERRRVWEVVEALEDMINLAGGLNDDDAWFGERRDANVRIEKAERLLASLREVK